MTTARTGDGSRDVLRAWLCLPFLVLSFLVGFAVAEGVAALFGYVDGDNRTVPWPVELLVLVVFVVVLAVPVGVAWWFAGRAARAGARNAAVPAIVGTVLVGMFVAVNVIAALVNLVTG